MAYGQKCEITTYPFIRVLAVAQTDCWDKISVISSVHASPRKICQWVTTID